VAALEEKFEPLRQMPLLGPQRNQLAPGLRVAFHGHYAIYYAPHDNELVIIRVLHSARDVAAIAEHGGFSENRT
jgi:toxin ParE1/3/4